ncbi:adenosine receptor A3-like [Gigantopelta aegis]|uniref:adenosine receptor A3-like n=1 Tax=Gigantopelta aegis TaxID=1735272 RepID=UPI001B88E0EB|nr:adenosine receptor A3-like [Gigantopelta aegis]
MTTEDNTLLFSTNASSSDVISFHEATIITIELGLMVFICSGNLLTILTVWLTPSLRTVSNMYVVSLAVADLLTGLNIPLQIGIFIPSVRRAIDASKYLCLCRHVLFFVSIENSILCMTLIALDWWLYIVSPFYYLRIATSSKARLVVVCSWIVSVWAGTMPLYVNKWTVGVDCKLLNVLTKEYQLYLQGGGFVLCSLTIGFCYGHIFVVARKYLKKVNGFQASAVNRKSRSSNDILRSDIKMVKMFILVFGAFFFCWFPTILCLSIGYTYGVSYTILNYVIPVGILNSGLNFFIYVIRNRQFREALEKMVRKWRSVLEPDPVEL